MASIKLRGDTSGELVIEAPAVAGTNTLTLPASTQTLATQNSLGVRNLIINGDMRIAQRGTSETGVATREQGAPNTTTADGDATGLSIVNTPFGDSDVTVTVNGLGVDLGNGVKDEACYFSGDAGTTARAIADITAGDTLHWMGSIAGYELDGTDEIDIKYERTSS